MARVPIAYEDGLYWPVGDVHCRPAAERQFRDADHAVALVRGRKVCVQAGGNCGVWPAYLAHHFDEVWTIEADFTNYRCLVKNTAGLENVRPIWAALVGEDGPAHVNLNRDPTNVGAHHVRPGFGVATITIDDLELEACDLIQLDIEGMEPRALEGARETIERFQPVIMVEDNGTCSRYGVNGGWPASFPGYREVKTVNRDHILVPCRY